MGRALRASPDHRLRGMRMPLGQRAQSLRKAVGVVERHLAAGITPPLGGRRMRGTFSPPIFRGAPRGDATAYAPGGALPGLMGPAPTDACLYAAAAGRPLSYGLLPTPP